MSRRINMSGFSIARMRQLLGSEDRAAIVRIEQELETNSSYLSDSHRKATLEVVERAIMKGIPFDDLGEESHIHASAARLLALDGQDWLHTMASVYHDSALEEGLWKLARKWGSPPTQAFVRGLVKGIPMFGSQPSTDDSTYAAISLEKLRFFRPGIADLHVQIEYRVSRKSSPSEDDRAAVEFSKEFCEWIDEIIDAERDLWFNFD